MGELEIDRKLEGTIVYAVLGRLHYGFDIFTLDLPHHLSLHSQPKFPNHKRLTDGKSINYNAQFVTPSDAKLLLQGPALQSPESRPHYEEEEQEMLVYVSERTGNARLHFSSAKAIGPVLGPLKGTVNDLGNPAFFFDRPLIRNGMAYFVSMQEPPDKLPKSWCAVYATCLKTGQTIRLTPPGVVDYSPAVSPSGKWLMVASYGAKDWERDHIQELHTDLYVFKAEDGLCRRMVAEQGGWPSWADENTVYFHRRAEDGWWSIYRLDLFDGSIQPERITPPSVDAFTPCASVTGNWIAVATRRPGSKFRHIEIFDLQSKSFIPVTESISPGVHHYNPFISSHSLKLGFHRFRGEDAEDADTVVPVLEPVESPIPKLKLQRINGAFPAFSPDGFLIAFNPNVGVPDGGVQVVKSDGSKRWELFKGPAFAVAWNGKHQGLLYASVGPVFAPNQSTVNVISISFNPEDLGDEYEVKSEVRFLTKEGTTNNAFPYSSPDGKQLVFRSGRSGHKNLYIMDAEKGEEGWIRPLTQGPWIDTMPCWSPDGQWIAFSSNRHDPHQDVYFSVYLIHPDGTGLHRIPGCDKDRINHIVFSPDSKSLLFPASYSGVSAEPVSLPHHYQPYGEIFVSALDGSHLQRLTFNSYEDGTPVWHQGSSANELDFDSLSVEKLKGEFDEPLWLAKS
ncbi:hypothetical protein SUGI_0308940 [Cryptomeria japonica]|uniref:uncharacterized protein LOC131069592 n=1 Tax=Cryptomeria japonica TaxID=3369 RepID=UPI002408EBAD|nr:uncharacterized protein LOC131069592 [Cryptomeria japonica]GLJ17705.1 hypothetical protein SUGI_0308940 [Cryptomeria japonica]